MEEFLNKKVAIVRKSNGFYFQGILINVTDLGITLRDRKKGLMYIPIGDIQDLEEVK